MLAKVDVLLPLELWADIEGYEGLYQVSNLGRIKSLQRNGTTNCDKILANNKSGRYARVGLRNVERKHFSVHRIVGNAFIPNPDNLPQIDHINGNNFDNRAENLRWTTALENRNNPITVTRHKDAMKSLTDNDRCKKVAQLSKKGDLLNEFISIKEAERQTGISKANISAAAKNKKRWASDHWATIRSAGGYMWKFIN